MMQKEQMEPVSLEGTKLFSYFRSSASWRVRIILNLKKIDYEIIPVHLLKDHQNSNFYKTLNPQGLLPALYIDGKTLVESMAMAEYLEETRKNPDMIKLLPADPYDRAIVRGLCEHVNAGMQPLQNLRTVLKVKQYGADKFEWWKYWNQIGLESLEKKLEKTAGKFAFGDSPTLADCFIFPQACGAFTRFGLNKDEFPILSKVYDNFFELQAVKDAMPGNQPDFEDRSKPKVEEVKEEVTEGDK